MRHLAMILGLALAPVAAVAQEGSLEQFRFNSIDGGEIGFADWEGPVLVANTDEDERQRLPGGGARVRLSWTPDHMHVLRESPENRQRGEGT